MGKKWLTTKEVAERLNVAPATLTEWRHEGKGPPFVKVSRNCVRYPEDQLERWMASYEAGEENAA